MTAPVEEPGESTVVGAAQGNRCAVERLALNDESPLPRNHRRDAICGNDDRMPPERADTEQDVVRHIDARPIEDILDQANSAPVGLYAEACALSEPVVSLQSRLRERAELFRISKSQARPPSQHQTGVDQDTLRAV